MLICYLCCCFENIIHALIHIWLTRLLIKVQVVKVIDKQLTFERRKISKIFRLITSWGLIINSAKNWKMISYSNKTDSRFHQPLQDIKFCVDMIYQCMLISIQQFSSPSYNKTSESFIRLKLSFSDTDPHTSGRGCRVHRLRNEQHGMDTLNELLSDSFVSEMAMILGYL